MVGPDGGQATFGKTGEGAVPGTVHSEVVRSGPNPVQGLAPLRQLFQNFLGQLPPGSLEKLEVSRQDIRGDSAYLLWRIPGLFALGTDTLVIRDGKIRLQSFAIAAN